MLNFGFALLSTPRYWQLADWFRRQTLDKLMLRL